MKKYGILSILFLILSLAGGLYLVKLNQDNRNRAAGLCVSNGNCCTSEQANSCSDKAQPICAGSDTLGQYCYTSKCWIESKCSTGVCRNAQCEEPIGPTPTGACTQLADACVPGSPNYCQATGTGGNSNTGYMCSCVPAGGGTDCSVWRCQNYEPENCPVAQNPTPISGNPCLNGFEKSVSGCITNKSSTTKKVNRYTCPNMTWPEAGGGCQENPESITLKSGQSACLGSDYCGVRQIDAVGGGDLCFVSAPRVCITPTTVTKKSTPTPTKAPTSTPRITNTPTPTGFLTSTPIPTSTPTGFLTSTPPPTSTPTSPSSPTNTPVPTDVLAQGPSPTRIILPESGIEFPSQILTIVGSIITLLGFLILL